MTTKLHKGWLLIPTLLLVQGCDSNLKSRQNGNETLSSQSLTTEKTTSVCSENKIKEILEVASADKLDVKINCNVTLKRSDVVTKVLDFMGPNASGVVFDCNGAVIDGHIAKQLRIDNKISMPMEMIKVRPVKGSDGTWQPPRGITIKNCELRGAARIWWGNQRNANGEEIIASSRKANHTAYMQGLAPREIHFVNMNFKAKDFGNMLYFGPGVTRSSVVDSKFTGHTTAGAIYFEAESAHNLVKGNVFETGSDRREMISVDASSDNIIINNKFLNLKMGGIFLYRNCGEKKVLRHTNPDNNIIVNNIFDYSKTKGEKYGIFVSSRTGGAKYCKDDDGYNYGSSLDDSSPARNNVIIQNQFIGQSVAESIKIAWSPNIERDNEKVSSASTRKAGCYIKNGSPKDFVNHGESVAVFLVNGTKTCTGKKISCVDGITEQSNVDCSTVSTKNVCYIEKNNYNRVVVRAEDGSGLAYFAENETSQAEKKLRELVDNKTCDSASRSAPIIVAKPPTTSPTPTPTPTPAPKSKNVCYIDLNSSNRLAVRNQDGSGIAYFDPSQASQAQAKLRELIAANACASNSKSTLPPLPPECVIELNNANRLVVRKKSTGEGLAYFAPNQKKEAEAKLKELQKAKTCR